MQEHNGNKDNLLYITHRGELLIWLIIILAVVVLFTIARLGKTHKLVNEHNIFMPDVDGLIVGSPVRMMGIEVGHITKIKPTNEDVFVKFVITDKDVSIPQGTVATVEFSGMAGSKSLELYLPEKGDYIDNNTPLLDVSPPKRLHDAFGLLNEMFNELGSIIKVSSSFANKLKMIEMPKAGSPQDLENLIKYSNEVLDNSIARMENLENKINAEREK